MSNVEKNYIPDMKIALLEQFITVGRKNGPIAVEYLTALQDTAKIFGWTDIVESMQKWSRAEFKLDR
jgi:hypothetical protein